MSLRAFIPALVLLAACRDQPPPSAASAHAITEPCTTAADCDDEKPCTTDVCNPSTKKCSNTPIPGCCESDFACADTDYCTWDCCNPTTNQCHHEWISD
ncbi:MAG: hypothetical protein ACOY3Y_15010, partial [Acidobacteriota bacterium]